MWQVHNRQSRPLSFSNSANRGQNRPVPEGAPATHRQGLFAGCLGSGREPASGPNWRNRERAGQSRTGYARQDRRRARRPPARAIGRMTRPPTEARVALPDRYLVPPPPPILGTMPAGPPWVGCFVLPCLLVVPPPPPMRLTFDLELLRLVTAWADPEKPGAMAGANAIGSAAGTTRNVAARNATRRLWGIISSQAGMNTKVSYHGCRLSRHIQDRPLPNSNLVRVRCEMCKRAGAYRLARWSQDGGRRSRIPGGSGRTLPGTTACRVDDPPFADPARRALVKALLACARRRRDRLLQGHLEAADGARHIVRLLGRHRSGNGRQTTGVPRRLCGDIRTAMPETGDVGRSKI
jgi:hypothetical protein